MGTSGSMSTSKTYIKYNISIAQNSQNISSNCSSVTVSVYFWHTSAGYATYGTGTCYCKINGTTYSASVSPSQKITTSGITLFSRTLDIYHESDGSKYLETSAWISMNTPLSSNEQGYGEWLSTIPRASSISLSNSSPEMGSTVGISISRASSSFTHTLTYGFGNAADTIASGASTYASWTVPLALANQIPSATSGLGLITCATYNGSVCIGSSSINFYPYVPSNVVPTINSVSLTEASSGVSEQFGAYVQGKSKIAGSLSASGIYGSSISNYSILVNNANYTSSSFTTDFLSSSGANTCSVTVTDSRGRTSSTTRTFTVVAYSNPAINSFSVSRCNADGTANDEGNCAKCVLSAAISSVNSKNAKEFKIMYKKLSETAWNTLQLSNSSYLLDTTQIIQNIDTESEYNFKIVATDFFASSEYSHNLSTAFTMVDYLSDGTGIAFGKVATTSNLFEVNFNSEFRQNVDINGTLKISGTNIFNLIYPVGSYYWSSSSTNPAALFGGTWAQVTDKFVLAAGSSYPAGSTGGAENVTLTTNQMPSHSHVIVAEDGYILGTYGGVGPSHGIRYDIASRGDTWFASATGGNQSHTNMPPYIVAYCWRRTA